jgi:hypothetical protein
VAQRRQADLTAARHASASLREAGGSIGGRGSDLAREDALDARRSARLDVLDRGGARSEAAWLARDRRER